MALGLTAAHDAHSALGLSDGPSKGIVKVTQNDQLLACIIEIKAGSDGNFLVVARKGAFDILPLDLKVPVTDLAKAETLGRGLGWATVKNAPPVFAFPVGLEQLQSVSKAKRLDLTFKDGTTRKLPLPGKKFFEAAKKVGACDLEKSRQLQALSAPLAYRFLRGELDSSPRALLALSVYNGQDGFELDRNEGGRILNTMEPSEFSTNAQAVATYVISNYEGKGVTANAEKAFATAKEFAKPGDYVSYVKALMLLDGIGTQRDPREARRLLTEVADVYPALALPRLVPLTTFRNSDGPDPSGALALIRRHKDAAIQTIPVDYISLLSEIDGARALPEIQEILNKTKNEEWLRQLVLMTGRQPWMTADNLYLLASEFRVRVPSIDILAAGVYWDGNDAIVADKAAAVSKLAGLAGHQSDDAFRAALGLVLISDTETQVPADALDKAREAVTAYLALHVERGRLKAIEEAGRYLRANDVERAAEAFAGNELSSGPVPGLFLISGERYETYGWRALLDQPTPESQDVARYRQLRVSNLLSRLIYMPPSELVASATAEKLRATLETAACGASFGTALQCGFAGDDDTARDIRLLVLAGQVGNKGYDARKIFDRAVAGRLSRPSDCSKEERTTIYKTIKACSRVPDPDKLAIKSAGAE